MTILKIIKDSVQFYFSNNIIMLVNYLFVYVVDMNSFIY